MSSFNPRGKPVDEGAITPLFLALLPENASGPKGELYAEKKRVEWTDLDWTWNWVMENEIFSSYLFEIEITRFWLD